MKKHPSNQSIKNRNIVQHLTLTLSFKSLLEISDIKARRGKRPVNRFCNNNFDSAFLCFIDQLFIMLELKSYWFAGCLSSPWREDYGEGQVLNLKHNLAFNSKDFETKSI